MDTKQAARGLNPALLVAMLFVAVVGYWVADQEFGPFYVAPEPRVEFAHPLSTRLDEVMRSNAEVLVIGDPDFVSRMRANEGAFGGSVQYLELPQVDLYAIIAIYPAILRSEATMFVMESIPAYWAGEVYMAVQPPKAAVDAALAQVRETEPTPVAADPPPGRDYVISPPTQAFSFAEAMRLVFDNYGGFWREVDDCTLWVTNEDLLAEASPNFQAAYRLQFADPTVLHANVGHVGSTSDAPALLEQCRQQRALREAGADD
ncbi:hypothetical protein U91I_01570 [alpha proteobacterium U9-1i]|nr:hypothetical protein U91I_01570 [alpha proteobacterium U9-1i]